MKKITPFIIFFLLGSGEYKPRPFKPKPYRPVNSKNKAPNPTTSQEDNYQYFEEDPKPKSEKALKDYIYSRERKNITINAIEFQQIKFTIKGTYKSENDLTNFMKSLKKSIRSEAGFELKKSQTRFAGSVTNHYELTGDNLF